MPEDSVEEKAARALVEYGGCAEARAGRLIGAWKDVFAEEALSVVAGTERIATSVTDQRVEHVRALVGKLDGEALPNAFELGVLLRVTETQARTVLRNWRARYPDHYEERMRLLAAQGTPEVGGTEEDPAHVVSYGSSDVLEYAVAFLRRRGLQQGLKVDRSALTLELPDSTTDPDGNGALAVLGIPQ